MGQLLLAIIAALLAGQVSILGIAEWLAAQDLALKTALGFSDGRNPAQSTLQRLLAKLSPASLEQAPTAYFDTKPGASGVVAVRATQVV